ncbi:hypothetical protein CFC21_040499 [Triticum aestivum]|uniref:Aminotransferase class V domain-containing protein n=3 Tax=Triticum TaxID=4564 RepID=A0A9R1FH32_WHEAT|nr:uncharacterized protein LOC123065117 [Triticum aestivum]KAF7028608.1 hypothetical protein CFC21_040499 [Triticum aestivum]CDM82124.1 unnamed protein product [Triticum aestivum]VAH74337.1 unnamed protein product [Triticum turgidum subsp. durum]
MCGKMDEVHLHMEHKDLPGGEFGGVRASMSKPPTSATSRPNSMVVKKVCPREYIPPHIVAEAISTLHGLDLRWSGPITPSERLYVEQYVMAKYPQYSHGLIEEESCDKDDLYSTYYSTGCMSASPEGGSGERRRPSPTGSPSSARPDIDMVRLEPSRLLDILTKKSSFTGSFISIPEIQARNRVLRHCGLTDDEYLVLFAATPKDAMMLIGESYPFFRSNYYMSILADDRDCIHAFAAYKEAKVIAAPESWLDLRIKGSQLSQYFRRKSKLTHKGLFAYPAVSAAAPAADDGIAPPPPRYSMHWVSEAHRNGWHVLLDATALVVGEDRLPLSLHRPDLVMCTLDDTHSQQPSAKVTCLLVRRRSFDASALPQPQQKQ